MVRSASGRESIVPNELLITQRVENASLADPNLMLTTVVQVDYGTDIEALRPALVAAVAQVPRVLAQPQPAVFLTHFAADGLELTVSFWIADPDGMDSVKSEVMVQLWDAFKREGIRVPYPVREIRVRGDTLPVETTLEVSN